MPMSLLTPAAGGLGSLGGFVDDLVVLRPLVDRLGRLVVRILLGQALLDPLLLLLLEPLPVGVGVGGEVGLMFVIFLPGEVERLARFLFLLLGRGGRRQASEREHEQGSPKPWCTITLHRKIIS